MFGYYLKDALRSTRRNPALSTLVVAAIAIGIGVSMTMLSLYYMMARNPIPEKSDVLFAVQVDSWGPLRPFDSNRPERAPHQLTWMDSMALLESGKARHQVAMFESGLVIQPSETSQLPFEVSARVTSSDFFPMFEPPFQYGQGWDARSEKDLAQVIVLSREVNDRLFGGEDSVGRIITANDREFTVVGVMDTWEPMPRFYDVINSGFDEVSDVFVPITLTPVMELRSFGSDYGWKPELIRTFADFLSSESAWLQYWAELHGKEEQDAYHAFLDAYAMEQKRLGRFERPLNNHIHDVMAWMEYNEVVEEDVRVLVGLGFLFLVVCLLSSISLLLTKFNGRAPEMSLRRALGANRSQIIGQNLMEVAVLGAIGGVLGLGLTKLSLLSLTSSITRAPDALFRIDPLMIGLAVVVAIVTSLLAGLYPAIKVCAIAPAQQLKTQ